MLLLSSAWSTDWADAREGPASLPVPRGRPRCGAGSLPRESEPDPESITVCGYSSPWLSDPEPGPDLRAPRPDLAPLPLLVPRPRPQVEPELLHLSRTGRTLAIKDWKVVRATQRAALNGSFMSSSSRFWTVDGRDGRMGSFAGAQYWGLGARSMPLRVQTLTRRHEPPSLSASCFSVTCRKKASRGSGPGGIFTPQPLTRQVKVGATATWKVFQWAVYCSAVAK